MNEANDPRQPEEEHHRSLEEIVEDMGFVETPAMRGLRLKVRELHLLGQPEEVISLGVEYRNGGLQLIEDSDPDSYSFLAIGLEISMASIWKGIDPQRQREALESAADLAYGYQFLSVLEDLSAMFEPEQEGTESAEPG